MPVCFRSFASCSGNENKGQRRQEEMLGSDEDPEGDGQPPRSLCPALHNFEYHGPTLWMMM